MIMIMIMNIIISINYIINLLLLPLGISGSWAPYLHSCRFLLGSRSYVNHWFGEFLFQFSPYYVKKTKLKLSTAGASLYIYTAILLFKYKIVDTKLSSLFWFAQAVN